MKKTFALLLSFALAFGAVGQETSASVDTVSVVNQYNKSAKTLTSYIKNFDNKSTKKVKMELQKNGKTINTSTISVAKNKQVKKVYKLSQKGKYRIKYTVNGKYTYTSTYNF